MSHVTASEAASLLEEQFQVRCTPRAISDLLYERRVPIDQCPLQSGRRLIPVELLPQIASLIKRNARRVS
jgi:hypothetical protein